MCIRDRYKSLFYRGNPASIILSLIGMDGYLAFKINDYYILGEWFIGCLLYTSQACQYALENIENKDKDKNEE